MTHNLAHMRPVEFARAEYRRHVVRALSEAGAPLSPDAALAVDALAVTHQDTMRTPLSLKAHAYFNAHAEAEGAPPFTDATLKAALLELDARGLLPAWCTLESEGVEW